MSYSKGAFNLPACTLQRKNTLLVEYKEMQKSNAFIDRRFGGDHGSPYVAGLCMHASSALAGSGAAVCHRN